MLFDFPVDPLFGQDWVGPDNMRYQWNGTAWDAVGALEAGTVTRVSTTTIGPAPPTLPLPADFWFSTESGFLYIYYDDGTSAQWVVANPGRGSA
jgi:hypothetical protein